MAIHVRALSPGAVRTSPPPLLTLAGIAIALGMLLPVVYLIIRATENNALLDTWTDPATIRTLARTCLLAAAVGAGTLAISLPAAWLTAATDLPFRRLWAVVLSLPLVFPSYVGAFILIGALGPRGMFHDVFGIDQLPDIYGFRGAWLVLTLFTFPYVMIPLRAAIAGLDRSMEEAARSLGASPMMAFIRVTLPQLRPAIAAGLLLVILYVLSDFGAVSLMRFDSLTRVIFVQYKSAFDRSTAASLALLLVAVAMAVVWLEAATRGRARYHTAAVRKATTVRLGHWKWPALAFCATITSVSLVLPAAVLVYWLVRGLDAGQSVSFVTGAAVNSVQASILGALACLVAALPIALLSVRYPGLIGRIIEKVSYSGICPPRHQHRARPRLLRSQLRARPLPDPPAPHLRLRRAVPPAGHGRLPHFTPAN